ncbi:MAG: ribosomal subunit interface protein [Deltaproteobacteria bacterium]|nr:MAG: ribosomal subunit interface protein [Deltaproteobacteria bacterium]
MQISITFRHAESSESVKQHAIDKMQKLKKYFDGIVEGHVILTQEKIRYLAEVTLSTNGIRLAAKYEGGDFPTAIDGMVAKIERQLKRYKEKLKRHKPITNRERRTLRTSVYEYASFEEPSGPRVKETGHYDTHPKTIDEAVMELDLMDSDFLVFTDESGAVKVVYRREDGDYGLIEPE